MKSNKAFTLIEVMVVIAVLTVLTVSIVPSFSGYLKNQNVKQAQETLKSDLRSVQNKALTGVLSDTGAYFWGILLAADSNGGPSKYIMYPVAEDSSAPGMPESTACSIGYSTPGGAEKYTVTLETGITIDETSLEGNDGAYTVGCIFFDRAKGDALFWELTVDAGTALATIKLDKDGAL